jgi:hypothetical protein
LGASSSSSSQIQACICSSSLTSSLSSAKCLPSPAPPPLHPVVPSVAFLSRSLAPTCSRRAPPRPSSSTGGRASPRRAPLQPPHQAPQGVELVPIVLPRGLPIELPCAPSCSPLSCFSSSSVCFPHAALVCLLAHQSHALNGGAPSNDRGEERDYPGKGGAASPHVFSALGYDNRWTIYSDTTPRNLGVSTLFHGLMEIA